MVINCSLLVISYWLFVVSETASYNVELTTYNSKSFSLYTFEF